MVDARQQDRVRYAIERPEAVRTIVVAGQSSRIRSLFQAAMDNRIAMEPATNSMARID
jgi:hypothetical protein